MGQTESAERRHVYKSGNTYEGTFRRQKRHGYGTMTWPDGTRYQGEWQNNSMEGEGVMRFANQNVIEGHFHDNDLDGQGKLTTIGGEVISGMWRCKGRSRSALNNYSSWVATYELDVTVTDTQSGVSQPYRGNATLYIDSGLVILPQMQAPGAVLPFAQAVVAETGRQVLVGALDGPVPVALAVPVQAHAAPVHPPAPMRPPGAGQMPVPVRVQAHPAQMPPAQATSMQMHTAGSGMDQALIDAEEREEAQFELRNQMQQGAAATGVAYAVNDGVAPPPQRVYKKVEVFNPRNYF